MKPIKNKISGRLFLLLLPVLLFTACEMTEEFKEELDDLPQISNSERYKYRAAYAVGDTLKITGILYPGKGLKVRVGDSEAPIVKAERIGYMGSKVNPEGKDSLDRVSVIVAEEMGTGVDRPLQLELKGNTVMGNSIDIYTLGGDGSFTQPLKIVNLYTFPSNRRTNTFLHCISGKGEVYYFNHTDRQLYRINKDASRDTLLTSAQVKGAGLWSFNATTPFLGGGVNPQGTKAWFTVITSQYNYLFCEADLQTRTTNVLNTSTAIGPVYQGAIGEVNAVISGAFPDSRGNVYVKIGTKNNDVAPGQGSSDQTIAVALYNTATGQLRYMFKTQRAGASVPGKALNNNYYMGSDFRFYPEEGNMYLIQSYSYANDNTGESYSSRGLTLYNLTTRLQQNDFYPGAGTEMIGPFSEVYSLIPSTFGLMPLPGQRILGLTGYDKNTAVYPKLLVIGFNAQRVYQYAPEILDQETNTFDATGTQNELLNYDEEGHLYLTANRRVNIVKTAINN